MCMHQKWNFNLGGNTEQILRPISRDEDFFCKIFGV